jgi:ribosomal protein S18 acetylase RimI-like enzyme
VTGIELSPFDEEHLDTAAALLAERHAWHRRVEPLLPERFEDPAAARAEIEALRRVDGASGVVALAGGGAVVGYLLGVPRADTQTWGPNIWVEPAGHATTGPELVRDLYAAAAARWLDAGLTRHYALVPSEPALVSAWFRVGFGQQHAYGIRETASSESRSTAGRVVVRDAAEPDVDVLLELAPQFREHQARAPVFSADPVLESEDELRTEFLDDLANPEIGTFVAEIDRSVVSAFVACPIELSSTHAGLARPPGAALLAWAMSRPERRGAGAGVALTDACLTWAAEHGHGVMVTDWRVTNLLASRFWPRRGFRETFLRLYRSIP